MSDSISRRVLSLYCGFTFPSTFPVFFRRFTGMMSFRRLLYDVLRVGFLRLFLCS